MRKKKTENVNIPEKPIEFKIKLTHAKKYLYPYNLEFTDYSKFKIGLLIQKGSTIYEITNIYRAVITEDKMKEWGSKLSSRGSSSVISNLIAEYKINSNFGACIIEVKPIIRGSKLVKKGRIKKFYELDECFPMNYGAKYSITNLENEVRQANWSKNIYLSKISNLTAKKDKYEQKERFIQSLIDAKTTIASMAEGIDEVIKEMIVEKSEEESEEITYKCDKCNKSIDSPDLHSCPYDSKINGDNSENCNCCADCESDCCQDI